MLTSTADTRFAPHGASVCDLLARTQTQRAKLLWHRRVNEHLSAPRSSAPPQVIELGRQGGLIAQCFSRTGGGPAEDGKAPLIFIS